MNPRGSVLACAVLLMFSAGFLLIADCTDDSEAADDLNWERTGDDVTVTGHGTLDWDPGWGGLKKLTVVPEGGAVSIGVNAFLEEDALRP